MFARGRVLARGGLSLRRYLTAFGLYIVTEPKLFDILKEIRTHTAANHAVQLTPALDQLRQDYGITGHILQARQRQRFSRPRSEHRALLARASATTSAARRRRTLRRTVAGCKQMAPRWCVRLLWRPSFGLLLGCSLRPRVDPCLLHPHRLNAFAHSGTPLGQLKEHQAEPELKRARK